MELLSSEKAMEYLLRHYSKEEWLSVIKPCTEAVCLNDGRPSVVRLLKLLESIPYKGFRNLYRALKSNRRTEAEKYIVELMQNRGGILNPLIVFAWKDLCDESFRKIKDAAVEGLRSRPNVKAKNTVEVSGAASDDSICEYFVEIAGYAKVPQSEIGLAVELCCLLASREYLATSDEGTFAEEDAKLFTSQEYITLLEAVKSAEEESPLLTEAEQFFIELRSVLDMKKQEFETKGQRVEQIKQAIENLKNQYSHVLAYFDLEIAYNTRISTEETSLKDFDELEKKLDAAQQHLDKKSITATTRKTEQAWSMEMEQLWTEVTSDPFICILTLAQETTKEIISIDQPKSEPELTSEPEPEANPEKEQDENPEQEPDVNNEKEQDENPEQEPDANNDV